MVYTALVLLLLAISKVKSVQVDGLSTGSHRILARIGAMPSLFVKKGSRKDALTGMANRLPGIPRKLFILASKGPKSPEEAKAAIEEAWKAAGKKLVATDPLTEAFLNAPLSRLDELLEAGKESIDRIVSFIGSGDRDKALSSSISFWKEKMDQVIKPFLQNSEAYRVLVVYYAQPLPQPSYDMAEENVKAEEELHQVMREEVSDLVEEYNQVARQDPKSVEDIPKTMWMKIAGRWPLEDTLRSMSDELRESRYSAGFVNPEEETGRVEKLMHKWDEDFRKNMNDLKET